LTSTTTQLESPPVTDAQTVRSVQTVAFQTLRHSVLTPGTVHPFRSNFYVQSSIKFGCQMVGGLFGGCFSLQQRFRRPFHQRICRITGRKLLGWLFKRRSSCLSELWVSSKLQCRGRRVAVAMLEFVSMHNKRL